LTRRTASRAGPLAFVMALETSARACSFRGSGSSLRGLRQLVQEHRNGKESEVQEDEMMPSLSIPRHDQGFPVTLLKVLFIHGCH
jgi:hypothetical protein